MLQTRGSYCKIQSLLVAVIGEQSVNEPCHEGVASTHAVNDMCYLVLLRFEQDLLVIDHAVHVFGLPKGLKLSVHSGSDKFSLYPVIGRLIRKHNKGIHIKTAGTTWLEEVIGLSLAGGEALEMVKRIYAGAISRFDELTAPYATVIDVDGSKLPAPETVQTWSGQQLANALRHIPGHPEYNPNARQLIHVAFKLAAAEGQKYLDLLEQHSEIVGQQVTENLFERHIKRIFLS